MTTDTVQTQDVGTTVNTESNEGNTETIQLERNESTQREPFTVPDQFLDSDGLPDVEKLTTSYNELYQKMRQTRPSAPKSPDEYSYDFTGDFEVDEQLTTAFKQEALDKGISPEQYSWIMEKYEGQLSNIPTASDVQASLSEVWGDNYDAELSSARSAAQAFLPEGIDINDPAIGNNGVLIQVLAKIGHEMGEDSGGSDYSGTVTGLTQTEVSDLMNRPDYWTNPEIQKRVNSYYNSKRK